MLKRSLVVFTLCVFSFVSVALAQSFTEGKQYKAVKVSPTIPARIQETKNKVSVVEFFSYGCPWCFHMEPILEKWLKNEPNYVTFSRVPVVFEQGWQVYSKAYFTAKALGKLHEITPKLFNAIHKQGLNLTSEAKMQKFFESQGISQSNFKSVYNFSPGIGVELDNAKNLMLAYKVFEIPTFIIDGKYMTNAGMTNGNYDELINVVKYLVNKEKAAKNLK